jgi:inward rectifier potassium channel
MAPYQGGQGLMFRLINERSDDLIDVQAEVAVSFIGRDGKRHFEELSLERDRVAFFPLSWTVVHPITPESPLFQLKSQDILKANVEVLVFITAVDEQLSRTVYAKSSYTASEILFGHKFVNIIERSEGGEMYVDPRRLDEIAPVEQ